MSVFDQFEPEGGIGFCPSQARGGAQGEAGEDGFGFHFFSFGFVE